MFEPAKLPRYSVVVGRIKLTNGKIEEKPLIVLGHRSGCLVCVKPTTDPSGFYARRPELLPACVVYEAGEDPHFEERTIIEVHVGSLFEPAYAEVRAGRPGTLPPDFEERLIAAIKASPRLDGYERRYLSTVMGVKF